jgi:hypothetical protein
MFTNLFSKQKTLNFILTQVLPILIHLETVFVFDRINEVSLKNDNIHSNDVDFKIMMIIIIIFSRTIYWHYHGDQYGSVVLVYSHVIRWVNWPRVWVRLSRMISNVQCLSNSIRKIHTDRQTIDTIENQIIIFH